MASLTAKEIKKLLRKEDTVILEIGANVGRDTQRFLDKFSNITLHCFEPDPRCIKKFKRRIDNKRCFLHELAISDENGESEFYLSGGSKPGHKSQHINSSSLHEPTGHLKKHPWCTFKEKEIVKTMTLDSWFDGANIENIDFIWADVQGAEEQLIKGGINTLNNTRFFYTEFSDDELYKGQINLKDIMSLIPNFRFRKRYGTNVLLEREC